MATNAQFQLLPQSLAELESTRTSRAKPRAKPAPVATIQQQETNTASLTPLASTVLELRFPLLLTSTSLIMEIQFRPSARTATCAPRAPTMANIQPEPAPKVLTALLGCKLSALKAPLV